MAPAHPRSVSQPAASALPTWAYGLGPQAFANAALLNATTTDCQVFPIALSTASVAGVQVGDTLGDIYSGSQPGTFGWLSWTGDPSEPTLVQSLTPPGNSDTYVNPADAADHEVSVGDWVQGKPGVSNSSAVRDALDTLEDYEIILPVYDQVTGSGSSVAYRISGFAKVRIIGYRLPSANRISVIYLGNADCGGGGDDDGGGDGGPGV